MKNQELGGINEEFTDTSSLEIRVLWFEMMHEGRFYMFVLYIFSFLFVFWTEMAKNKNNDFNFKVCIS